MELLLFILIGGIAGSAISIGDHQKNKQGDILFGILGAITAIALLSYFGFSNPSFNIYSLVFGAIGAFFVALIGRKMFELHA